MRDTACSLPAESLRQRLTAGTKAGFGIGQVASQLFRDVPSLLLLFYLTAVMGIPPALAGSAIFVPKVVFGAVFDLGVGLASDRLAERLPRRHLLLLGGLAAPVAMLAVFAVPQAATGVQIGWVVVTFSLYMAVYATFSVPYLAQFAELSDDPAERTELMAWKHGFTGLGVLLSSALAPALVGWLGGGRSGYLCTMLAVGLACLACLATAWTFAGRIATPPRTARPMTLAELPAAFRDRQFAVLCLSAVMMTTAAGTSYASFPFFVRFAMGRADALMQMGVMSAIMAVAVMLGSPVWVWVAARIGKKRTYVLAACGHGLVTLVWGALVRAPIGISYGLSALNAIFNAGWGLIVLALLADAVAGAREQLGENRAGCYAAIWSVIEKAGIAAGGTLILGWLLAAGGFDARAAQAGLAQSPHAVAGIIASYSLWPGLAKLAAASTIWRLVPDDRPAERKA